MKINNNKCIIVILQSKKKQEIQKCQKCDFIVINVSEVTI